LFTPVVNLRVNVANGLVQESLAVNTRIKKCGEGSGRGQVARGGKLSGLHATEAMGAGGRVLEVVVEEVENPASGLRDAAAKTGLERGKVEESVGGLEVWGGQLCVV